MKKLFVLSIILFIATGCAKQPVIANLNPHLPDQQANLYSRGSSVAIVGQDLRKTPEVVIYENDDPPTRLANVSTMVNLIMVKLSQGLQDQGLTVLSSSKVHIKFAIQEFAVHVTHQKLLYNSVAKTHIVVTVEHQGDVYTKVFKREANKETAGRPDLVPELESMLNNQLADILQQILQEEEIQRLIVRQ